MACKQCRVRGASTVVFPDISDEENARRLQNYEDVVNRCLRIIGAKPIKLNSVSVYSKAGA